MPTSVFKYISLPVLAADLGAVAGYGGIYSGSGTVPGGTIATITDTLRLNGRIGINIAPSATRDLDVSNQAIIRTGTAGTVACYGYNTATSGTNRGFLSQCVGASSGTSYGLESVANGLGTGTNIAILANASNASTANIGIQITNVPAGAANYAFQSVTSAQSYFGGDVGIGADPLFQLQVDRNDTAVDAQILMNQQSTGDAVLGWIADAQAWTMGIDNSNSNSLNIASGSDLATNTRMVILPTGEVGINVFIPTFTLEVDGTSKIGDASHWFETDGTNVEFNYLNGGASAIVAIDSTGNIDLVSDDGTATSTGLLDQTSVFFSVDDGTDTSSLELKGDHIAFDGSVKWNGKLSSATTGTINNFNPAGMNSALVIRMTGASAITFTGIVPPASSPSGTRITIELHGNTTLAFNHDDAGSTAANRFYLPGAANITGISQYGSATFEYDSTHSRWLCIAQT